MKAEIVSVGTELLLGQIPNTNAQTISRALADAGIDVYYHSVVGDNLQRMTAALRHALTRCDLIIITGGLGPTPDDITREGVAAALDRPLLLDEGLAGKIRALFESRGRVMPETNLRQAYLPQGARAIAPEGTAPGFFCEPGAKLVVALPGIPWEMEEMLGKAVVPELRRRAGNYVIHSRHMLVIGLGESQVHERISDIVDVQTNPTIAYLAGGGQVRVRLSAKAGSEDEARALIEPVEKEVRERLGNYAVAGSHWSIASALGAALRARGATVAAAESLTGGLIGSSIVTVTGSSDYFAGSIVCYATAAKRDACGIEAALLDEFGPVSPEVARALAEAAAKIFGADLGVSATGVAGPATQDGHPIGDIYVGATYKGKTEARHVRGYGTRDSIRAIAATSALDLGRRLLLSDDQ